MYVEERCPPGHNRSHIPAGAASSLTASTGASTAGVVVDSVVVAAVSSVGTATGFCSSAIVIWVWVGLGGRKMGISKNQKLEDKGWVMRRYCRSRKSLTEDALSLRVIDIPFCADGKSKTAERGS